MPSNMMGRSSWRVRGNPGQGGRHRFEQPGNRETSISVSFGVSLDLFLVSFKVDPYTSCKWSYRINGEKLKMGNWGESGAGFGLNVI